MNRRMLRIPWGRWILIIAMIVVCLFFVLIHYHQPKQIPSAAINQPNTVAATQTKQTRWFANPSLSWAEVTVKRGDSLYQIFKNNHIESF